MMQDDEGIEDFKYYGADNSDLLAEDENVGQESPMPEGAEMVKRLEGKRDETYAWVEEMGSCGVAL